MSYAMQCAIIFTKAPAGTTLRNCHTLPPSIIGVHIRLKLFVCHQFFTFLAESKESRICGAFVAVHGNHLTWLRCSAPVGCVFATRRNERYR